MREFIDLVNSLNEAALLESNRAPLYHGTEIHSAMEILIDGEIHGNQQYANNPHGVSLSRDYRTALEFGRYWERDFPVVFVFDQEAIRQSPLKLLPRVDKCNLGVYRETECEEMVLGNLPLNPYLLSINVSESEIERALSKSGREYLEYLQHDCGVEMTWREWKASIAKLRAHPKFNAMPHRHADMHQQAVNKTYGAY